MLYIAERQTKNSRYQHPDDEIINTEQHFVEKIMLS